MTRPSDDELQEAVRAEVARLHDVIAAWFRGDLPRDAAAFDAAFTDRLAPGFVNIQPAGKALTREALAAAIRDGHGANPAFRIATGEVTLRAASPDGRLLAATYVETQEGARNSDPPRNRRVSTVVFARGADGGLSWLHLQETALP